MIEQEPIDTDLAIRAAMLFELGMQEEDALRLMALPYSQLTAWEDLWESLELEAREKSNRG
jgi:hypothetical protein